MAKELSKLAKVLDDKGKIERLRAELISRPIRIAFLIREDISHQNLAEILEFNSVVWGGYYNYLVPTDGENIDNSWLENLEIYGPDIIVFCGDNLDPKGNVVSPTLHELLENEIQPFSFYNWIQWQEKNDVLKRHEEGWADRWIKALPMLPILAYTFDTLSNPMTSENSKVSIPNIDIQNRFYTYVAAQVGIVHGIYRKVYLEDFKGESVAFDSEDLDKYLENIAFVHQRANPINLTRRYITGNFNLRFDRSRPEGLSIVLTGSNLVRDFCIFWNLRLTENFLLQNVSELILPIDLFRSSKNLAKLASFLENNEIFRSNKITLFSDSVHVKRLRSLAQRLNKNVRRSEIKVSKDRLLLVGDLQLRSTTEHIELVTESDRFSFRRPNLEFHEFIRDGHWVVDVKTDRKDELPWSSKLNHNLCCKLDKKRINLYGGYWVRYQYGRYCCRAWEKANFINGCLVEAKDAFFGAFQDQDFHTKLSDKHPFTEGLLNLLGTSKILETQGVRDLFWEMQSGKTLTFNDLKSHLKLGNKCDDVIDELVHKDILLRGMTFTCASCGYSRWYPINILAERVQCVGCLNWLRPPVKAPIVFRLNELVARAVSQGAIPVLLTQRCLNMRTVAHKLALFGIVVKNSQIESELDLVTTFDGHIVVAECKDFKNGVLQKEKSKSLKQLTSLVRMAEYAKIPAVIFSTLLPLGRPEIHDFAKHARKLNKRGKVAVHILSLTEMNFLDLKSPRKTTEHFFLTQRVTD